MAEPTLEFIAQQLEHVLALQHEMRADLQAIKARLELLMAQVVKLNELLGLISERRHD
jgi:hypothetical protein